MTPHMKKWLALLLILLLLPGLGFAGLDETALDLGIGTGKIAILTGTADQNQEEYHAAQTLQALYPDQIITDTYSHNFSSDVQNTIDCLLRFAADPEVKAIIMVQVVLGASEGFAQVRALRDDLLLIGGVMGEDAAEMSASMDIVLNADEINQGRQLVEIASEWGCDQIVHYSFTRHMSYETVVARYNLMSLLCGEAGIELVFRNAPDPMGALGTEGAQEYILEDLRAYMLENPDQKIAFFSTNCSLQAPMQQAILEFENAYYPLPCCPSPFHGFPASLELPVGDEEWGDFDLYLSKTAERLAQADALDRFSSWPIAINMGMINSMVDYSARWIRGETEGKVDSVAIVQCLEQVSGGYEVELAHYILEDGTVLDNTFMILVDPVDYRDYLIAAE